MVGHLAAVLHIDHGNPELPAGEHNPQLASEIREEHGARCRLLKYRPVVVAFTREDVKADQHIPRVEAHLRGDPVDEFGQSPKSEPRPRGDSRKRTGAEPQSSFRAHVDRGNRVIVRLHRGTRQLCHWPVALELHKKRVGDGCKAFAVEPLVMLGLRDENQTGRLRDLPGLTAHGREFRT